MSSLAQVDAASVVGELSMFDRLIFKGHLTGLYPDGAFAAFLSRQGVLLKDFKHYVAASTARVKAHAEVMAAEEGRPIRYLAEATTKRQGTSKEDLARQIAERDGVTEGLVCVFSVLEPCTSFDVRGNRATHRLEVVRRRRKCLHLYFYVIDPELGWCHIRLQTWFPFTVQVWVNGRDWLARQLDRRGVGYLRWANALLAVDDLATARRLAERFARRRWPALLDVLARRVNPLLADVGRAGFGGYWWAIDQAEVATDILFGSRAGLEAVWPDLARHAATALSSGDVLRFLGRRLHPALAGEVTTSTYHRPEGWRVKHALNRNSIKIYDKASVLRVETTINNPREFKVLRVTTTPEGRRPRRWMPMGKGVANLWRYWQVATAANDRYLDALTAAPLHGKALATLDALCRPRTKAGRRFARLHPIEPADATLFAAVLAGEHAIAGFRNRDLARRLHPHPPADPDEARRRCARTCRLIAKLRAHGLVAKVHSTRRYRTTPYGNRVMTAALHVRQTAFPTAYAIPAP